MNPLDVLRELGPGSAPLPDAERRVRQRVLTAIAVSSAGILAGTLPLPSPAPLGKAGAVIHGSFWQSKVAAMAVSWLVGGGMGAAIYGALRPPAPPLSATPPAAPGLPAPVSSAPTAENEGVSPAVSALPALLTTRPSVAPPSSSSNATARRGLAGEELQTGSALAHERALLDDARAKAAQGKAEEVLSQVERHLAQHPNGRLAEEREALAIQALLRLERYDEARARARAFRERYPNSLMNVAIEPALER